MTKRTANVKPFVVLPDDEIVICRCEEITRGEIRLAINQGMLTINEIKRYLRAGMGLCQGQTCYKLVVNILARELGLSPSEIEPASARPPTRPIAMGVYAMEVASDEK